MVMDSFSFSENMNVTEECFIVRRLSQISKKLDHLHFKQLIQIQTIVVAENFGSINYSL